jgi:hypothetical protein
MKITFASGLYRIYELGRVDWILKILTRHLIYNIYFLEFLIYYYI